MTEYELPGLSAPVTMKIDRWGLPHIKAENLPDLFFAQGFNAARDRLWQIDLWRKRGLGLLAADFGPGYLMQDRAARLFLYRGDMEPEWAAYGDDAEMICTAFANGINAAVDQVLAGNMPMPEEFSVLGTTPAHWHPEDVVRIRTHCLTRNAGSELARAQVLALADPETDLLRAPLNPPVDASEWAVNAGAGLPAHALSVFELATAPVTFSPERLSVTLEDAACWSRVDKAKTVVQAPSMEGSNNWVVSGQRTASGRPIMASDPHRAHAAPSLRYMVHLTAPGLNVIGAGEPSSPGIMAGHNGHAAFSLTIFCADQEDVMVYDTDPADALRYRYKDGWEEMETVSERFAVRGHPDQDLDLHFTRHGPVVWQDADSNRALALRTVFTNPGTAPYMTSLKTMRATSFAAFRQDAGTWGAPSVNLVYGDVTGDFGWQAAGYVPRRDGWRGLVPVAGDGRFEWQGYLTSRDLPYLDNPAQGYVHSANEMNLPPEAQTGPAIGHEWFEDQRAARIADALAARDDHDLDSSTALQTDTFSPFAPRLIALLPEDVPGADLLRLWDCRSDAESAPALLYELWLSSHLRPALLALIAPDPDLRRFLAPGNIPVVTEILEGLHPALSHRAQLDKQGARDALMRDTLAAALQEATDRFGAPENWHWGDLHHGWFDHALTPVKAGFDLGPWAKGGGNTSIMLAHHEASDYRVKIGASVRMVIDVGDWDKSVWINAPGQSGMQASQHVQDLAPLWAKGDYVPLAYSENVINEVTVRTVVLRPAQN
ncbi:penicillin acylase family protein [Thalassovita mangrovi]|uniref:Penicillin acylase family protein n=1 Tax=Thalassovita mangrovi TaxID=2692236 RepID=A0A6L8LMM7_9RHOB|nr:penicillin acylase family protein [Thalassovita mangrovi]MYM56823.1 penicillin acylase family protein [Thalassovita mangrovi]